MGVGVDVGAEVGVKVGVGSGVSVLVRGGVSVDAGADVAVGDGVAGEVQATRKRTMSRITESRRWFICTRPPSLLRHRRAGSGRPFAPSKES